MSLPFLGPPRWWAATLAFPGMLDRRAATRKVKIPLGEPGPYAGKVGGEAFAGFPKWRSPISKEGSIVRLDTYARQHSV